MLTHGWAKGRDDVGGGNYIRDWSDAPDRTGGCYSPVTFDGRLAGEPAVATVRTCCASG